MALFSVMTHAANAAGADGAVGMVLDVQGTGTIKEAAGVSKLQLLSYLKPEMQVTVDAGGKASLSIYSTRTVYQVTGPAVVEIAKDKINSLQGKPPVAKSMTEKLVVAAENTTVTPGAYRMRSLWKPEFSPANNSMVFIKQPNFSWNGTADAYDFQLEDDSGKPVMTTKVSSNNIKLPASVRLIEGTTYRWTVAFMNEQGKKQSASAEFTVATKAETDALVDSKPAAGASIEEWILYAAMLEKAGLDAEAKSAWAILYRQRPDLEKARDVR